MIRSELGEPDATVAGDKYAALWISCGTLLDLTVG